MSSSAAASLKADLLLVLVTLLAAVSWIFSKEAVLLMPPLLFMALRFLLAGLLLALLGWRQIRALNVRQIRRATRVGMVFGFGMSCWIMGLHAGGHLGEGAFLTNLGVVLVPLLAALLFGERAPLSTWLALPVAGAGLALLFLQHGLRPAPGQLFYVLAAGIFALFYILNTRAANERPGAPGGRGDKVPPLALTASSDAGPVVGEVESERHRHGRRCRRVADTPGGVSPTLAGPARQPGWPITSKKPLRRMRIPPVTAQPVFSTTEKSPGNRAMF